jgi:hypothetical protein
MKRRAANEPNIGHLKAEHRLERNRLKGTQGNAIKAPAPCRRYEFPEAPRLLFVPFIPPPAFAVRPGIPGSVFGGDVAGVFFRIDSLGLKGSRAAFVGL